MYEQVMEKLGYTFRDEALLRRALTHPSVGREDNQRLEFLGDAVLQYIMSDRLYRKHPEDREGSLTHMRALLVCEASLSVIALRLGIGEALTMDRGEELTGGRTKPSVLCDAMEAVLAAVYLDGGMEAARAVVERCWPEEGEVSRPMQDSKGQLQEMLQKDGGEAPIYRITGTSGPPHAPVFEARVYQRDTELGQGSGKTKKQAEQAAALEAIRRLREREEKKDGKDQH
jgi:ribonuclease-3